MLHFHTWHDWLHMGGYAVSVWLAYGLFFTLVFGFVLGSRIRVRRACAQIKTKNSVQTTVTKVYVSETVA